MSGTRVGLCIRSQKDFVSGLMFSVAGVAFALGASGYRVGNGARMGPGYFPLTLGVLLTVLGAVITLGALGRRPDAREAIGSPAWRALLFIILANLVFGVMIGGLAPLHLPPMGLIAGVYAVAVIASLADDAFRLRDALLLGTGLSALSYVAFVWLLKLQLPVWPVFWGG